MRGCTRATVGHCVTSEKLSIPSVPVITKAYVELAKSTAAQRGMPTLRIVYTPHPISRKTPEQIRALLDGPDPISGKPMMKEAIEYFTTPLTPQDQKSGLQPVSLGPDRFGPDTAENLQKYFMDN